MIRTIVSRRGKKNYRRTAHLVSYSHCFKQWDVPWVTKWGARSTTW